MRKIKQWLGIYKSYTVYYNNRPVVLRESHRCYKLKSHEFSGAHVISDLMWSESTVIFKEKRNSYKPIGYLTDKIKRNKEQWIKDNELWHKNMKEKDLWQKTGIDDILIEPKDKVYIYDGLKFYSAYKEINNS